jgi:integrase
MELLKYIKKIANQYYKENKHASYLNYIKFYNKINRFLSTKKQVNILVSQIDYDFIIEYQNYITFELKNSENYVINETSKFKKIINQAIYDGIVETSNNPFQNIENKRRKIVKKYLDEIELNIFANYPLKYKSKNDLYRDLFVFSCDCGGIKSNEIIKCKKNDYDGKYLSLNNKYSTIKIKVPKRSIKIIEKYYNDNIESEFLFPIREHIDLNNSLESHERIKSIIKNMNVSIQNTILKTKINKSITFSDSRSTFAFRAFRKGIRIEIIQKLMRFENIKELKIYSDLFNNNFDNIMTKIEQ